MKEGNTDILIVGAWHAENGCVNASNRLQSYSDLGGFELGRLEVAFKAVYGGLQHFQIASDSMMQIQRGVSFSANVAYETF